MAQPESDDLSQLMPNLRQRAQAEAASPASTAALREYIKVPGRKRGARGSPCSGCCARQREAAGASPRQIRPSLALQVLGEKPSNVPAASTLPNKPRTDGLAPRAGSGRRPQRRFFTIKLRYAAGALPPHQGCRSSPYLNAK